MRLVLMGTGSFAVPTFDSLVHSHHDVVAAVTRPVSRHRGRRKIASNPVRDLLAPLDVSLLTPEDVNATEAIQELDTLNADVLVVCDFGQILSSRTLETARLGAINLHASLLPRYRGAAPINWALWNGESETGVTVIHMTPRLDAGPCLTQARTAIGPEEDAVRLEQRLARLGIEQVDRALRMLEHWDGQTTLGQVQDQAEATKAPRLKKSHGRVDWSQPAERIENQVRALRPWPGTYTEWHGAKGPMRLILDKVSVVDDRVVPPDARPGRILDNTGDRLVVATGGGCLGIHRVQPAGKRAMPVREFLRGHPVQVGELLA
ncbi:MAG: methionyl-tRNA formyltransferase [Planctomycetota bacterium]